MSHHNTPEVQTQVCILLTRMFKKIIQEDTMAVDAEIGETAAFHECNDLHSVYSFTLGETTHLIEMTEDQVSDFLNDDERAVDYVDGVVFGILCEMEDATAE